MIRRLSCAAVTALVVTGLVRPLLTVQAEETIDADVAVLTGTVQLSPVVALVGGGGAFTFSSSMCEVVSASGGAPAPSGCSANASGDYGNIVCGTGNATGSGSLSENGGETYTSPLFTIQFFSGVGVLSGLAEETDSSGTTSRPLSGVVVLIPTPAVPPLGDCVENFTAEADLATTA
jgi:hypothetical protein